MNIDQINARARLAQIDIMTTEDAALFLGRSTSYIYKLMQSGKIKFTKPTGKVAFIERKSLEDFAKQTNVSIG